MQRYLLVVDQGGGGVVIAHQFICKVAQHEKALVQTHPVDAERLHEIAIIVVTFIFLLLNV